MARHSIDPGNLFDVEGTQFVPFPLWIRDFFFLILKPHEVRIFLYIISSVGLRPSAPVSFREMQHALGLSHRKDLIASIDVLLEYGFLLREEGIVADLSIGPERAVFQRPSQAYTLLRLLELGMVDSTFHATIKAEQRVRKARKLKKEAVVDRQVYYMLERLLGNDFVQLFERTPEGRRLDLLASSLRTKVQNDRRNPTPPRAWTKMSGWPGWEKALLQGIGAPITHENVAFLQHWAFMEAGTAAYNPLNTTQFVTGATNYNTFGDRGQFHVRNYPNEQSGLAATIQTLQNGRFNNILHGLQSGNPLSTGSVNVAHDLKTWGTIHFAEEISAGWNPPPNTELNDIESDHKGNRVDSRTGERGTG
jgi:hypothetical protein